MKFSQKTFVLLCGTPGTGKSTMAARLLADNPGFVLLSSDARVEERAAKEGLSYQDAYIKHAKDVLEELRRDAIAVMKAGRGVIWDQTHLTPAVRAERLSLVPGGYAKVAIASEIDAEEADRRIARRATATGKSIPDYVLAGQRQQYVRPTHAEAFDEIFVESLGHLERMSPPGRVQQGHSGPER